MKKQPNSCIKCGRAIFSDDYHTCDSCALATHAGAAAAEPSDAEVSDFVERTVGLWREYDRADVLKLTKAALTSAPAVPEATVLKGVDELVCEAYEHWEADREVKVGKILLALLGHKNGYDPRADAWRAALKGVQPGERGEEGDWYCEDHPEHLMGHDGCNGMGVIESARIPMLVRLLKIATQETREANQMRDDMVARVRASKQEVP